MKKSTKGFPFDSMLESFLKDPEKAVNAILKNAGGAGGSIFAQFFTHDRVVDNAVGQSNVLKSIVSAIGRTDTSESFLELMIKKDESSVLNTFLDKFKPDTLVDQISGRTGAKDMFKKALTNDESALGKILREILEELGYTKASKGGVKICG